MKDFRDLKRAVPPRLTQGSSDADIEAEMAAHLERLTEELRRQGLDPEEAAREAARRFGDAKRLQAEVRHIDAPRERSLRRSTWMGSLVQDLRYCGRQVRRSPGHAAVIVITLALGIGLTTSMFTVVDGVLLRPLPFPEPDELMALGVERPGRVNGAPNIRDQHFVEVEHGLSSFEHVAGSLSYPPVTLTGAGEAARLNASWVTREFFDVLGVMPALGRDFEPAEHEQGAPGAVILGDALWRGRFGADPDIFGKTAIIDGIPRTIVGVMPPGLRFPGRTDLWLPDRAHPLRRLGVSFSYPTIGRLRPGVPVDRAREELAAFVRSAELRIGSDEPETRIVGLQDVIVGNSRYPLMVFSAGVALVLLISCTNVANLLLMRATSRAHEIGLRRALGAGRGRLLRQLLTESVVFACAGGALGMAVAAAGVRALLAMAPPDAIPRGQEVGIDTTVLAFTVAVSVVTGIAFGLFPALQATRRELRDTLAQSARTHVHGGGVARGALVVTQLGFAVVLLTGAGLLVRSFQQIRAVDLGFDPQETLSFDVDLPQDTYTSPDASLGLYERVLTGLSGLSGVEVAGAANFEPFGGLSLSTRVVAEDSAAGRVTTGAIVASPGWFRAMGIPVISGRGFVAADDGGSPGVAIVSRALARRLWPDGDAVGRRLSSGGQEWLAVVGVVEDIVRGDLTVERGPVMYRPLAQMDEASQLNHVSYVVRTKVSAAAIGAAMRQVVREADPNLPVASASSMDQIVLDSLGERVFQTRVLGVFALLALLLAAVGVYGVTAYSVGERMRELGIRVVMGARGAELAALTLRRTLVLTVAGLLVGGAVAAATTRLIAASLYDVTPTDPTTFVVAALVLGAVALAAALVPARRASRVDPVKVLAA